MTIIPTTGPDANAPFVNLGEIQNTGFDLGLGFSDEYSFRMVLWCRYDTFCL